MTEEQQSLTTKSYNKVLQQSLTTKSYNKVLMCELTDVNVCVLAATQRRWLE